MKFETASWYQQHWQELTQSLFSQEPNWLSSFRKENLESFLTVSFPTKKQEEWKYTDLAKMSQCPFSVNLSQRHLNKDLMTDAEIDCHSMVFINGHFSSELSWIGDLPSGVMLTSLQQEFKKVDSSIQTYLTLEDNKSGISSLNAAFMTDGVFIYLPKNTCIQKPVRIQFITDNTTQKGEMNNLRNIIIAEENAEFTLFEEFLSQESSAVFTNVVTEMRLDKSARANYIKIQKENNQTFHLSSTRIIQEENSQFSSHVFTLGSELARDNLQIELNGSGADCILNGLYLLSQKQLSDHHTSIHHNVAHTTSAEIYKGILSDESKAVFNGKIKVKPNAQKTNAQLINQNLLLSSKAEANTKPELEIDADDVRCTHGATVGQIDEAMLFYFRARGIDVCCAYHMLVEGFTNEIIESIKNKEVAKKIQQELQLRIEKLQVGERK